MISQPRHVNNRKEYIFRRVDKELQEGNVTNIALVFPLFTKLLSKTKVMLDECVEE